MTDRSGGVPDAPLRNAAPGPSLPAEDVALVTSEDATAPREEIRNLVAAYAATLDAADALRWFVPVRTRYRRPRLLKPIAVLPRPRWMLRSFLVYHMIGTIDALRRRYRRRAALDVGDDRDALDLRVLDQFRLSLPELHTKRLVALLLISVLVVGRAVLVPVTHVMEWADEGTVETDAASLIELQPAAAGAGSEAAAGAAGEFFSIVGQLLEVLPGLIEQALSAATLDFGSSGRLLESLLEAGILALAVLVLYLALVLYLVLRPFVAPFRLKRMLFNRHPEPEQSLEDAIAPWHASHSGGVYLLEAAAFQAIGQRSRRSVETPFDLAVLALPALALVVPAFVLSVLVGRLIGAEFAGLGAYAGGGYAALVFALIVVAPIVARAVWLRGVHRGRRLASKAAPGEWRLADSDAVVLVRRPGAIAAIAGVPLLIVLGLSVVSIAVFLEMVDALGAPQVSVPELVLDVARGWLSDMFLIMAASVPWWYRVARELRDVGSVYGQRLGRWPAVGVAVAFLPLISMYTLFLSLLRWSELPNADPPIKLLQGLWWLVLATFVLMIFVTAFRVRRAQHRVGLPASRLPPWLLPAGLLAPPLLFWHLQAQLNRVWSRVARPVGETTPTPTYPEPLHPRPVGRSPQHRLLAVAVTAVAFAAAAAIAIEPGPDQYGENQQLDALWNACEDEDFSACDALYRDAPLGSRYRQFALETCCL